MTTTVKLVDRRLRIVEVAGPRPPEWRRPTLKYDPYGPDFPRDVAFCLKAGSSSSRFIVDRSAAGDAFLAEVAKAPKVATPYGTGWVVRE